MNVNNNNISLKENNNDISLDIQEEIKEDPIIKEDIPLQ